MQLNTALKQFLGKTDTERQVGPFQLLRPLGRGGEAPVWLAREVYGSTELRLAAVKLFALDPSESVESGWSRSATRSHRTHVVEEAKALCRVEHPSIVRFYSIASNDAGSVLAVAMEYLSGTSLDARLGVKGSLSLDDALALGASIASALSAVHRAGLVHRDVKPANIVDSSGTYKLIDFGIAWEEPNDEWRARATLPVLVDDLPLEVSAIEKGQIPGAVTFRHQPVLQLTDASVPSGSRGQTGTPGLHSGTFGYVDPVCLRDGAPATAASDIYALGVVLFECATGLHPAAAAAGPGKGLKHAVIAGLEPAPDLATIASDLPSSFCALVAQMLAPQREGRPRSCDWIAMELERIRGEAGGVRRELPPESVGPFRGLGRFEHGDRDVYFGRSTEIAATIELLRSHGLVTLVGPSGSGKSSLARAGVLPRIEDGALGRRVEAWDVATASPGHDPRGAILTALGSLPAIEGLAALRVDPELEPTAVVAWLAGRAQSHGRGALLFVDQLEELVTMVDPREEASRRWAADLLIAFGQSSVPGVRALVTARRDLLDPLLSFQGLGKALVRGTLLVEPMSDATWGDVLQQALAAYGYQLEDEALATELLEQLRGTAGAMPLVQFALTELWNKRDREIARVTRAGLAQIGGIAGSLERHAEATVAALGPTAEGAVRELLLALTTPQGTRATVDLVTLTGGDAERRRVIEALEHARLVVSGPEGVTLAHDALLVQWRRLRGWLAEVREDRLLAEELERDAERWSADPEGVALWQRRRLGMARALSGAAHAKLSPRATTFLRASQRAERRGRVAVAVLSLVVAALGAASVFGYVRGVRADEAAAQERAQLEESKAAVELARRMELEQAQVQLDGRQKKIDELVSQLAHAEDPKMIEDVQRRMREEQASAHATQQRIVAARPTPPPPPAPAPTAVGPKIQREDP